MADWQVILREHAPLVWQTARRLLANEADAADCFQETFLSALQLSRRQTVKNWPGLLQHLATARALDLLRRRIHRQHTSQRVGDIEAIASSAAGPPAQAQGIELGDRLREAIAQLPVQQSEVFCLRNLNELSYAAIASELGLSEDAVGVTLHRARRRLREILISIDADQPAAR